MTFETIVIIALVILIFLVFHLSQQLAQLIIDLAALRDRYAPEVDDPATDDGFDIDRKAKT